MNEGARAYAIAESVRDRASLARYASLERQAVEFLSGKDTFAQRRALVQMLNDEERSDDFFADMSPEDTTSLALSTCETLGIPRERVVNVLLSSKAEKSLAEARRSSCRWVHHLERAQVEESPGTLFLLPTEKRILCKKLGHKSHVMHVDAEPLLAAFQREYCGACGAKSPRREG